ncbi:MAG: hypothetical protein GY714_20225 [Desulfobacterales bacterium]|nr:hypothetical protein [Desulfobacterales bacterium]
MTTEEIKANIIKRDGYFKDARTILVMVNGYCPWEAERRMEFFDNLVKTICAMPSKETKDYELDYASKFITAVGAVYAKSESIGLIRSLLSALIELITLGSTLKCGGP